MAVAIPSINNANFADTVRGLAEGLKPRGLDLSAFGALTDCQRRGVKVPGQMWVAGFGVYEITGVPVPSRTTITPFPRKIGAWTAALILEVLDTRQVGQVQGGIAPVRLIRQSSRQSVR